MKVRSVLLLLLATVLLFNCSCQKQPDIPSDGEITEQPEPQYMAYHLGNASRVDDDIYLVIFASSNNGISIVATEYGSENLDTYVPCFDTVCDHKKRSQCCVETAPWEMLTRQLVAFSYNGEPALVIFNPIDTCFSRPYSNVKINLVCEDFLNVNNTSDAYNEWRKSDSKVQRSELFVYKDYLYYVELKNGTRTQYRISLTGGEPERVFEEDNIIIRTIINDRFYGIRYDIDPNSTDGIVARENIHYFRSDMNYQNVEPLPQKLEFFSLLSDDSKNSLIILEADEEFIYTKRGTKILAFSDSDINAEPVLLSDTEGKIPTDLPSPSPVSLGYNGGTVYSVISTDQYERKVLDRYGINERKMSWYESSTLYSYDIKTGECKELDISSPNYLIDKILYADDKYVYAEGSYVHDDNRSQQGATMRLTLDTMRYEVILPDIFWEYSAETTAE